MAQLRETQAWREGAVPTSDHPLIIAAGHGRTGTTTLQEALQLLGITADHYSRRTMELVHAAEHEKDVRPSLS